MKNNNRLGLLNQRKGFTLIELLGVIVILAIIIGLVVVSMTGVINTGKKGAYKTYERTFTLSAQNYLTDYPDEEPTEDKSSKIYLKELISKGYVENFNDPNGGNCNVDSNNSYVLVKKTINVSNVSNKFEYKTCLICLNGSVETYISDDCDVSSNTTIYLIDYNLNGGYANNPTRYSADTNTFTLNQPTKPGYNFLGWTGSNGTIPQIDVTISKGSTGNKNYTANWETSNLNFIGTVINRTYGDETSETTFAGASGGSGSYTYTEKGGTAANYASVYGTTITIQNTIPAGTYTYVVTATDNNLSATKDAIFTINVSKKATTLSSSPASAIISCGGSSTISLTTNGDGDLSCTVNPTSKASCSISGSSLTIRGNSGQSGSASITVSQGAGTNYSAANITISLTITACYSWHYYADFYTTDNCYDRCDVVCERDFVTGNWGCSTSSVNGSTPTGSGEYCHCGY